MSPRALFNQFLTLPAGSEENFLALPGVSEESFQKILSIARAAGVSEEKILKNLSIARDLGGIFLEVCCVARALR